MTHPPGSHAALDPLVGRVLDERYRVESFIARGGMATVYRGADLRLERTVAIKVMHPSFASDPGFVDRFEREARAAARLNSPYAVGLHDQGNDAGLTYLVMEYVPGHTVRDVLNTHGSLSPAQALAILDPVLEALSAAHRAGYVHRDIKPENVLISDDGRVKVTDFGLARAIEGGDAAGTRGLLLGTVAYLSPEQVEHDAIDARSDVYSAGILLFELLTGTVPFSGAAPMQVAYRHVHEDVPTPSSVRDGLSPALDQLVASATRRAPQDRYRDASDFLAAVRVQRAALPPAAPLMPTPHDTLVVGHPGAPAPPVVASSPAPAVGAASVGPAVAAVAADAARVDAPIGSDAPSPASSSVEADVSAAPGSADTSATHLTAPDEDGTDRPRRGRKAMWLGAMALICAGVVVFLLFGPLQRVSVPNVLGKTPTEATAILATANLLLDASPTAFSEDYPAGQIMSTDPDPETRTRTGSTVLATVSKGPERYQVPDLKGLTVEEADVALSAAHLALGAQTQQYDDKVKKSRIISSSPDKGQSVKPGTEVAVIVSQGPQPVTIPKVVGTDADSAKATLTGLGLKVDVDEEYSESVPKGEVISISPKEGATAHRGDTVTLKVSQGPPLVTVPNVVGQSESNAKQKLQDAGFKVEVHKPLGFAVFGVNSQSPSGGSKAPKGSTVRITVV